MNQNLKLGLVLFLAMTNIIETSTALQEQTKIFPEVSSIVSISNKTDSVFEELAKSENIPYLERTISGSWSPDGSKLLIRTSYNPFNDAGLDALYILNSDCTELEEIIATRNNTKERSLSLPANEYGEIVQWNPDGDIIAFSTNVFPLNECVIISDYSGLFLKAIGTDFATVDAIRKNISNIPRQIGFSWNPTGMNALVIIDNQLCLVDKDSSVLKHLTNKSIENKIRSAVWSHDGKKIAFNGANLWVISENGTGLKQLADEGRVIDWSHDNAKIYYRTSKNGKYTFHVINSDGSGDTEIGEVSRVDYLIAGPCGKILFTKTVFYDKLISSRLYVADTDGKNQTLLGESDSELDYLRVPATWSPSGDKIAFTSGVINYDGTENCAIKLGSHFSWHPSGNYIAFEYGGMIDGAYTGHVYLTTANGTDIMQITPNDDSRYSLEDWSPDGSRLLIRKYGNDGSQELLTVNFNGYDKVMHLYVPDNITIGRDFQILVKSMSQRVQSAEITLNEEKIGTTNEEGYLSYTINESGNYVLKASRQGYVISSKLITVNDKKTPLAQKDENVFDPTEKSNFKTPGFCFLWSLVALIVTTIKGRI